MYQECLVQPGRTTISLSLYKQMKFPVEIWNVQNNKLQHPPITHQFSLSNIRKDAIQDITVQFAVVIAAHKRPQHKSSQ